MAPSAPTPSDRLPSRLSLTEAADQSANRTHIPTMSNQNKDYYNGLNLKLLNAIPSSSKNILELGCANGRLGQKFKERHPDARWHGVEINNEAALQAASHLDQVTVANIESADLPALGNDYDTIVIGDLLEHLTSPETVLAKLYDITSPDATLICCVPNFSHQSVIQRLIAGDIAYDNDGLLDRTHLRFYSPSSLFRTLLDASWLPDMKDQYTVENSESDFRDALLQVTRALGIPDATAKRNFDCYQMVVACKKWKINQITRPGPRSPFSVIVPINRKWQANLNVLRSPGLREIGAEVLCVQAKSAAEAYEIGSQQAKHPWRLMVHQDVYFPEGTGYAIAQQLGAISATNSHAGPVGFAGLAMVADSDQVRYAGLVVDRTHLFDHGASNCAISVDEFAVALHESSPLKIDPALGWHLWATDLCLQASKLENKNQSKILEVPLFHNSVNDYALPEAFRHSAEYLLSKHSHLAEIKTLCGNLSRKNVSN